MSNGEIRTATVRERRGNGECRIERLRSTTQSAIPNPQSSTNVLRSSTPTVQVFRKDPRPGPPPPDRQAARCRLIRPTRGPGGFFLLHMRKDKRRC
jgi:hypothetical protein